eukprot:TRINITY_DN4286_c0_g1_i1.p1 TRINITY_DN4286_c0_g1~~TRINITY_DN4286_c0_g1_i1.p1  ORF type:complete len:114 (-),score=21.80 TRINITY_DN4286_c0_g1_i1:126-440(-)
MSVQLVNFAFAALVAIGGSIGYMKAGSTKSLIAGLVSGAILAYGSSKLPNKDGYYIVIGMSFLLGLGMGFRYLNAENPKFMPAGLVGCLGMILTVFNGFSLITN